jgi:metal-responsive CopG/Arc/MetJ family transcriptional regulator
MKVAVSIPDPVFEQAEHFAKRLGKSRSQLYAEAVAEFLKTHRTDAVTEQLNAVYANESSLVEDAFQSAQFRVLQREDW